MVEEGMEEQLKTPEVLSDSQLRSEGHRLVKDERRASSLFAYCTQVLHLSEHEAYGRIEAARAARRWPVVLELLAEGSLHLTAIALLGRHLTTENHEALLAAARHKTKRQLEEIVAALRPQPVVPSRTTGDGSDSPHPGSRKTCCMGPGWRTVCVRRSGRPMPRARFRRVSPRGPVRGWRGDER
jgi:hypothetical protein